MQRNQTPFFVSLSLLMFFVVVLILAGIFPAAASPPQTSELHPTFATHPISILLIDDDGNAPDVQNTYAQMLHTLGFPVAVWNMSAGSSVPPATLLNSFQVVVWFTGQRDGGLSAGSETSLTSYLDSGGCAFISSQRYYSSRGLTAFMSSHLGVASGASDVGQTTVTGSGSVFGGLGSYNLIGSTNHLNDRISPDGTAELALSGNNGDAGINKDATHYRTTYWGLPFENLPTNSIRAHTFNLILNWCAGIVPITTTPTTSPSASETPSPTATATPTETATPAVSPTPAPNTNILLVDDDGDVPDVRSAYATTLNAFDIGYDIWDTGTLSNTEPSANDLSAYNTVIWFSGNNSGASAGPSPAGEAALASFLDAGNCLFLSSQNYFDGQGQTNFMSTYLGVSTVITDSGYLTVTGGMNSIFDNLGPYSLAGANNQGNDGLTPDNTAVVAFTGNVGNAGIAKDAGSYRTTFLGFPLENLPAGAARQDTLNAFLQWCNVLFTPPTATASSPTDTPAATSSATPTSSGPTATSSGPIDTPVVTPSPTHTPSGPTSTPSATATLTPLPIQTATPVVTNQPPNPTPASNLRILLVDDDPSLSNARNTYTAILDVFNVTYDVWSTGIFGNFEPATATIANYDAIIWFTGRAFGNTVGPSAQAEAVLSGYLDAGNCLFLTSQDYFSVRGVTPFMINYLGVDAIHGDGVKKRKREVGLRGWKMMVR